MFWGFGTEPANTSVMLNIPSFCRDQPVPEVPGRNVNLSKSAYFPSVLPYGLKLPAKGADWLEVVRGSAPTGRTSCSSVPGHAVNTFRFLLPKSSSPEEYPESGLSSVHWICLEIAARESVHCCSLCLHAEASPGVQGSANCYRPIRGRGH